MGNKLNNPNTSQKSYWKIIDKCKVAKIPLLVNNLYTLNCRAKLFADFYSQQGKPVINQCFTRFQLLDKWKNKTDTYRKRGYYFINPQVNLNKANGSDGISGQMLLLCLRIISRNILSTM